MESQTGIGAQIIDSDAHITEPWNLWTDRMSRARWGDLVPKVKWDDEQNRQLWYVGETPIADLGFTTVFRGEGGVRTRLADPDQTRGQATRAYYPRTFDEMHPSSWDPAERLKAMDEAGVSAACLYPNLLLFNSRVIEAAGADAAAFSTDAMRAYNDFIVDFASEAAGRIIPLACLPYWDITASVQELERCAERGCRGVVMSGYPQQHEAPYLADPQWDVLWSAAQAADLPVHFHAGSGDISSYSNSSRTGLESNPALTSARQATEILLTNMFPIIDVLSAGILARHPRLRFVNVESGVGWIPFALESLDRHFQYYNVPKYATEFTLLPSECFRRQVYTTVWFERLTEAHLDIVGHNNIMFETDYPHPTCIMPPDVQGATDLVVGGLAKSAANRILRDNALELYRW